MSDVQETAVPPQELANQTFGTWQLMGNPAAQPIPREPDVWTRLDAVIGRLEKVVAALEREEYR
jgi:hypothetical protein